MKNKLLVLGLIYLSAIISIDFGNIGSDSDGRNIYLDDLTLFNTANAECYQVWVDNDGDGVKEEYVYYCDDDDDPWWGDDDRWTLSDYPCISSASGSFSVGWDAETKSFSVSCSGSYTVSHYVSKCGQGGELTSCWSEMC